MRCTRLMSVPMLIGLVVVPVAAQLPSNATTRAEEPPALFVSADAEIQVAPDRAHLSVAVETRGRTSQQAGAESARIQTAVLEALRRLGVESAQLQTRAVQVTPEYLYPREGGRPSVTGYVARNEVVVDVRDLTRIGSLIDASLAQGATSIGGPHFSLTNPDSARRVALDLAVRKAVADAQAMARAAGVRVGRVLEIRSDASTSSVAEGSQARVLMSAADAAPTPVESGLITIRSSVRLKVAILP